MYLLQLDILELLLLRCSSPCLFEPEWVQTRHDHTLSSHAIVTGQLGCQDGARTDNTHASFLFTVYILDFQPAPKAWWWVSRAGAPGGYPAPKSWAPCWRQAGWRSRGASWKTGSSAGSCCVGISFSTTRTKMKPSPRWEAHSLCLEGITTGLQGKANYAQEIGRCRETVPSLHYSGTQASDSVQWHFTGISKVKSPMFLVSQPVLFKRIHSFSNKHVSLWCW